MNLPRVIAYSWLQRKELEAKGHARERYQTTAEHFLQARPPARTRWEVERLFIPNGMKLPGPRKGEWRHIREVMDGMLGEHPEQQRVTQVNHWLKQAYL